MSCNNFDVVVCPQAQSRAIIEDSFPFIPPTSTEVNALLDSSVTSLSLQTIDDFPVTDPRWAESVPQGISFLINNV